MSSFTIPLDKVALKSGMKLRAVAKTAAFQLFDAVQVGTPVDEGRARGAWMVTQGSPATGTEGLDPTPKGQQSVQTASEASKVFGFDFSSVWFLTNNLPYIRRLEYEGWSNQAPAGMLRINVIEYKASVDRLVNSYK